MKKVILEVIIPLIMGAVVKVLKPAQIERVADRALDWCEDAIKESANTYDNKIVLPLIDLIREAFHIEDNDDPVKKIE